jgi:hypothetical protein
MFTKHAANLWVQQWAWVFLTLVAKKSNLFTTVITTKKHGNAHWFS